MGRAAAVSWAFIAAGTGLGAVVTGSSFEVAGGPGAPLVGRADRPVGQGGELVGDEEAMQDVAGPAGQHRGQPGQGGYLAWKENLEPRAQHHVEHHVGYLIR